MPAASASVKQQLNSVMKKFKFEEFEKIVIPNFPEISWDEIKARLIKNHESFTSNNVSKIIEKLITRHKITENELRNRLDLLEVIEVSRHHKRKYWYAYELRGTTDTSNLIPNRELQDRMLNSFQILQLDTNIKISTYQGITFISIIQKKKSKRLLPIYFALFLRHGYFFCAKKTITNDFLQGIIDGLGYTNYKKLKLMGKNLQSLITMIELKKQGTVKCKNLCNSPKYQDAEPIVKITGTDFRQHKQRRDYIKECFGNEPPTIDILEIKSSGISWADEEINNKLNNININIGWEFKSQDVADCLLRLFEKRIFINPPPLYVTKLMETGRNQLTVTHQ